MEQWIEINECPRCGQSHALSFLGLLNAKDDYSAWASCPKTYQPILLQLEQKYIVESTK